MTDTAKNSVILHAHYNFLSVRKTAEKIVAVVKKVSVCMDDNFFFQFRFERNTITV